MKIAILDRGTLGTDTPLDILSSLGEIKEFDKTDIEDIPINAEGADVVIVNKVKIGKAEMERLPTLKLICVFATGYDGIDVKAAKEKGIAVCNVPAYSTDSVALYTVSTALALYTHLYEYVDFVRSGEYYKAGLANRLIPVYHEISGKTWGIVGYGNIGKAVARAANALGAKVIVNKRTPEEGVECVDIDTLCRKSDIISVHCPLNDSSRSLINKERLSFMKRDVVLVNEARGAVLDEEAVANAVLEGKIGAFGCDVYSAEPFSPSHPYEKIKNMKNVLLTPHAAWGAYEARERCVKVIFDNITAFFKGEIHNRVEL